MLKNLYQTERERLLSLSVFSKLTGEFENPVFGEGNENCVLMFVGEAPGKEETLLSRPFVGKAGKQLDELLNIANINRNDVFVTNTVKYRPTKIKKAVSNRTPTTKEIKESALCLKQEIEIVKPKVIATLGNSPLYSIANIFELGILKIGEVHGKKIELSNNLILFPLYHPASVIYNRALMDTLKTDMQSLAMLLNSNI